MIERTYTLRPSSRTTIQVDVIPGLEHAEVSAAIRATQPIIVERAMYWGVPWIEAHNSAGVTSTGTRWVLAEGEHGGPLDHATYLLLANPGDQEATVTVTLLRHGGLPALQAVLTVAPHSRRTIDSRHFAQLLPAEQFGFLIDATQPIVVERAMYWTGGGERWGAGTNETGTRMR